MATKPTPGASDGTWGTEMNTFLDVSLDVNGKIATEALQTDSTAPSADAAVANKKYVDDEIVTGVATRAFGEQTTEDDDANNMLKAHAYLANQDGHITAYVTNAAGTETITGYIDTDTNPVSGGDIVARAKTATAGEIMFISFPVASEKYFEITTGSSNAVTILVAGTFFMISHS